MKKIYLLIISVLFLLISLVMSGEKPASAAGQTSFPKELTADQLYQKGLNLMGQEKYHDARTCFEEATKRKRNFAESYLQMGLCYIKLLEPDKAKQNLTFAKTLAGKNTALEKKADNLLANFSEEIETEQMSRQEKIEKKETTQEENASAAVDYFNQGDYAKSEKLLSTIANISPSSEYLLAQTYEFQGKIDQATKAYQKVCNASKDRVVGDTSSITDWMRFSPGYTDLSLCAIKRITSLQKQFSKPSGQNRPEAAYVGEDRTTRDDWQDKYGKYLYILCAQEGFFDTMGGPAKEKFREMVKIKEGVYMEKIKYRTYIGNPSDTARNWIAMGKPSQDSLMNPVLKKRMNSCWDDHGEVYPIGKGPDLFFEIKIPEEGKFLLSFYFFNIDSPYRRYTIYIIDKEKNKILTAAEVKDFNSGVYKKFSIPGNKEITVRICRDLSVNAMVSGVFIDKIQSVQ